MARQSPFSTCGRLQTAGVSVLYTEDMGAPTAIDGIQLINPLI